VTVTEFIASTPAGPIKCLCCKNPKLRAAIESFALARASGKTKISWQYFHRNYILKEFGQPKALGSVTSHVRVCMARKEKKH
jgi:hypothetical protein